MSEEKKENNGESIVPSGEHKEESSTEYGKWDAMSDICTDKDFLSTVKDFFAMIERSVDKIVDAIKNNKKEDSDIKKQFEKNRITYYWQKFILSFLVIVLLGLSAAYKWLSQESIIPLLAGVIASLFVTPKKD